MRALGDAGELGGDRDREPVAAGVDVARQRLARGLGDQPVGAGRVDRLEGLEVDLGGGREQGAPVVEGDHDVGGGQVAEERALRVAVRPWSNPPKAPVASPEASLGSHSARCSSEPAAEMTSAAPAVPSSGLGAQA